MIRFHFRRVPSIDTDAPGTSAERLAGTGTTESHSTVKLGINAPGCISTGAVPIRVVWSGTKGTSARVSTEDFIIPAYTLFTWDVTAADCFVSIEEASGSSGYEAFVYTCGR